MHTDSTVTKATVNKGRSKNPYINCLLRKMAWHCARLNCNLAAVHVACSLNVMADTISRLHEGRLHVLFGQAADLLSPWWTFALRWSETQTVVTVTLQ